MLSFVLCSRVVFVFKQKTAYEMRISDRSSDVCSSDLKGGLCAPGRLAVPRGVPTGSEAIPARRRLRRRRADFTTKDTKVTRGQSGAQIGRPSCRERVCRYV